MPESSLNTDDVSEYVVSGNPGRTLVGFVLPGLARAVVLEFGSLAVDSGGMAWGKSDTWDFPVDSFLRRDLLRFLGRATDREPGNTKAGEARVEAPPLDELDDPELDSAA